MARLYRKLRTLPSPAALVVIPAMALFACEAPPAEPEPKPPPSTVYSDALQQARDATDAVNANIGNNQQSIDELLGRDQPAAR